MPNSSSKAHAGTPSASLSGLLAGTARPSPLAVGTVPGLVRPSAHADEPRIGRVLTVAVLAVHVVGGWGLLQLEPVRQAIASAAPIMVSMIAPAEPKPAPPVPPPPRPQVSKPVPKAAPIIAAAPTAEPAPTTFVAPPPDPAPAPVTAPAAPPAPPAPPVVAAAPQPKAVPASALRYVVEPPLEVPAMSRRARESGRVVLRVVVDVRGFPKDVSVQQSSGFPRLDNQAVWAMRQARFRPYTENGQAMEAAALAPVEYEL